MMYFDCRCEVGPRSQKDIAAPWSAADVVGWMDLVGIDGALVSHTLAMTTDPVKARERLREELSIAPDRLFPVWGILPPDARDVDETPDQLLKRLDAADVHAVKIWPKSHRYPASADVLAPMLGALQEAAIPLLVDYGELPSEPTVAYAVLDAILAAFPRLPVLLLGGQWAFQRVIAALMARYENLHLDFSAMQSNRGLEVYSERFGAERLLFGTGLPAMSAGAARAYIDYAMIDAETKQKIAAGNLSRLLKGLAPAAAPRPEPDPIRDLAREGKPLDIPVWDAHCHMLADGQNSEGPTVMYRGDADGHLELMDAMGVDKTAIMSWNGPIGGDIAENEIIARAVERHPDRYMGVCYINPTHHTAEELMAEVRHRVEEQGFVALKPYVSSGVPYNDDLYEPFWEYADEKDLYVLLHLGGNVGGTEAVNDLAAQYLNVQWVIAHTGGSFGMARKVVALMKEHYNVWAELTLTPVTNGVIEWMVGEVGDERILFGTDAPMRDPRPQFGWVVWANLPVESRRRILGENFRRLLRM